MLGIRRLHPVLLLVLWPLLAGCAMLPGTPQSSSPAPTPQAHALATQVAAAVAATVTALTPGRMPADPQSPGPARDAGSSATSTTSPVPHASPTASGTPGRPSGTPSATSAPATATITATPSPTTAPTPVILAPTHLGEMELVGGKLFPHYWTNTHAIVFSMVTAPGTTDGMRPQVEVQPLRHPYTGTPTATGQPIQPSRPGTVTVQVGSLPEGAYHWQARLTDGAGHDGPWTNYYQGPAFRLDRTPPLAPVISSTTDPDQHATYSNPMVRLSWTKPFDRGGVQGYLTGIDRDPKGVPSGPISSVAGTVLGPLLSGTLYFHVRAVDWAGNLGAIASYVLHIDHRVPILTHVYFERYQFNPQFDKLTMTFVPDKTVQVRVEIHQQKTKGLVRILSEGQAAAGTTMTVSWDGRDQHGAFVQPDQYTMVVFLTDKLGNIGDGYYADLGVNFRRIVVHLATQTMDVYDGATLLRSALVTTGNQHLPTPVGVWHVLFKKHPYSFLSPWKKGSPFWYPTTPVSYVLNFHAGGYFLHDASWRSVFGPGTNSSPGLPGSGIYAGSHGCVEMPPSVAQWLYGWAPIGTVVDVMAQ